MPSCSARGCRNRSGRGLKITFHLFPKNDEARLRWVPATGRKNWIPGKRAVMCSDHFDEQCFDRTGQTTRLRLGAIPTKGKFAPKSKKFQKQIFIKQEPEDEPNPNPPAQPTNKNGITTRSGRQLSGRMAAVVAAMKKDPSEEEMVTVDPDDPIPPDPSTDPSNDLSPSKYPDHFYCRTSNEMETLLRKSERKLKFLKMKLNYLNTTPDSVVKQEPPPDWPQFYRESLEKEAEIIKASLKAGKPIPRTGNNKDLLEKGEQLREQLKEAQEIRKQIKVVQQRNRRKKKKSKAKFFRYVVMIEPTKGGKKATATCTPVENDNNEEGEEDTIEEESPPTEEQVSSIQESILSHTASMVVGQTDMIHKKDKQVKDLQKKVRIAKLKEKRKTEQMQHLYEVIEILKERCPEYSTQKEHITQRRCSLCHSPLLKRCHQIANTWDTFDRTDDLTLPPLWPKPHPCHTIPKRPWHDIGVKFCSHCQKLGRSSRLDQRRSLVCRLRPQC